MHLTRVQGALLLFAGSARFCHGAPQPVAMAMPAPAVPPESNSPADLLSGPPIQCVEGVNLEACTTWAAAVQHAGLGGELDEKWKIDPPAWLGEMELDLTARSEDVLALSADLKARDNGDKGDGEEDNDIDGDNDDNDVQIEHDDDDDLIDIDIDTKKRNPSSRVNHARDDDHCGPMPLEDLPITTKPPIVEPRKLPELPFLRDDSSNLPTTYEKCERYRSEKHKQKCNEKEMAKEQERREKCRGKKKKCCMMMAAFTPMVKCCLQKCY